MLEESYRRKHREFDFSIGDEDYKRLYTTHARLLGPIGRAPVQQRILARVKHGAKRALSLNRKLLEMALGLRDVIRKRGNRAYLLDRSDQQALTLVPGSRGGSRSS
jgi:CelD/BcsL family acetyltransferase involved in cellulose biosynthesis